MKLYLKRTCLAKLKKQLLAAYNQEKELKTKWGTWKIFQELSSVESGWMAKGVERIGEGKGREIHFPLGSSTDKLVSCNGRPSRAILFQ